MGWLTGIDRGRLWAAITGTPAAGTPESQSRASSLSILRHFTYLKMCKISQIKPLCINNLTFSSLPKNAHKISLLNASSEKAQSAAQQTHDTPRSHNGAIPQHPDKYWQSHHQGSSTRQLRLKLVFRTTHLPKTTLNS